MPVARRLDLAVWLGCLQALVVLGAFPRPAAACSCIATTLLDEPRSGATGVQLDRALLISGDFAPDEVELEAEGGEPVDFAFRYEHWLGSCTGLWGEIVPAAPLEPDTTYVVRMLNSAGEAIEQRFTTGDEMVPEKALSAPDLRASFVRGDDVPTNSCTYGDVAGCIGLGGAQQYELSMDIEGTTYTVITRLQGLEPFDPTAVPECVRVRARDDAGRYSEPTELCGDELRARASKPADFDEGMLRCSDGVIGDDTTSDDPADAQDAGVDDTFGSRGGSSGCSATGAVGAAAGPRWALLLLALGLGRLRRRGR